MKKFLSIALAVVMTLTLSVGIYAADTPSGATQDVTVTVDVNEVANYDISFDWDSFDFTYKITKTYTPKTETETAYYYETGLWYVGEDTENGAASQTANVTVTNKSNAKVKVSISYAETNPIEGVDTDFDAVTDKILKNAADDSDAVNPESVGTTFTISGDPTSEAAAADVTIGTVTVSVVAAN